jgi:DNA-binding winged helix-turn-helix (wHTH) protein
MSNRKRRGDLDMTNSAFLSLDGANRAATEASLEFGRFRVLLRQRQLLADGVPIELGTRAFELLLVLLKANGSPVTKEQLLARVWPGIVVAEDNLKAQVFKLRRALGEDRDFIRTEFGRGYRFTATVRSTVARSPSQCPTRQWCRSTRGFFSRRIIRRPPLGWSLRIKQPRFCVHPETPRSGEIK